ncbi:hypothetical protein Hanom_Chr06g00516901 [Helianthus anomalus]
MYRALYICMYICVCEWGRMGHALMVFARIEILSPIMPAIVVWLGAMRRHGLVSRDIPPHYGWSYRVIFFLLLLLV